MDKVGLPRALFYYYYGDIWKYFLESLKVPYIISPETNKDIIDRGMKVANDEMCLAFKIYLGHIDYLKDKCNYIIVPRINNYKTTNQTCTNFLAAYDIINNTFNFNILNYNIDLDNHETLKKGLYEIGKNLNKTSKEIHKAYNEAMYKYNLKRNKNIQININKLNSKKLKILLISHPYNTYDNLVGKDIIKYLTKNNIEIIYSDKFDDKITNKLSKNYTKDLYFKYNRDNIGALYFSRKQIDGAIFISAFPCALDSITNELVMRKLKLPCINLLIDDNSSFTGLETRLESFIDMLKGVTNV